MSANAPAAERDLFRREQAVARRHIGRFPWGSLVWFALNTLCWLCLWPLVLLGVIPLWLGGVIAVLNVTLSYLPSHEAQHDIYARPGSRWRWVNELVGHLSTLPLVLPYRMAKLTHLEHHKHTLVDGLDPDHSTAAPGPWSAIWKTVEQRQPGAKGGLNAYPLCLERLGRQDVLLDAAAAQLLFYGFLFAMAWSGFALEALFLWWLPQQLGLTYIRFFLSWAPHYPELSPGRYGNTRSFKSRLGNVLSMGMQYHCVHHLHPRIPLFRTGPAYFEMLDVLRARGMALDPALEAKRREGRAAPQPVPAE